MKKLFVRALPYVLLSLVFVFFAQVLFTPVSAAEPSEAGNACALGSPDNADWSKLNEYDAFFIESGEEFNVPPNVLKSMAKIESGSLGQFNADGSVLIRQCDSYDCNPAVGMMQVKPAYHYDKLGMTPQEAYDYVLTPEGNVRMAAAIMGSGIKAHGSWEGAIRNVYFPGTDSGTRTTQDDYINRVKEYLGVLGGAECSSSNGGSGSGTPTTDPNSGQSTCVVTKVGKSFCFPHTPCELCQDWWLQYESQRLR